MYKRQAPGTKELSEVTVGFLPRLPVKLSPGGANFRWPDRAQLVLVYFLAAPEAPAGPPAEATSPT